MCFSALTPVQLVFPMDRTVFLKEESAKLYSTFAYFMSRNIIEIPYSIIFPLLQTLILYWFVGLTSTVHQFFIFYLVGYLVTLNGVSLGLVLGSIISDAKSVSAITPIIVIPFILFSGFFKNSGNVPDWIGWIQYVSSMKYSYIVWLNNEVDSRPSAIDS